MCRWVLVYRHEYHGEVEGWLGDVLGDAERERLPGIDVLPRNLAGHDRFDSYILPVLGTPVPGDDNVEATARQMFQATIERPLALLNPRGVRRYPWTFVDDGAARLAAAFAATRQRRPRDPLVPELQVVLAHLLEAAGPPDGRCEVRVEVGEDCGKLIDTALESHLRRCLDPAFPRRGGDGRAARTHALLALRELSDAEGRRGEGLTDEALEGMLGSDKAAFVDQLTAPRARLIVWNGERFVLPHDRLAEVVVRVVDEELFTSGLDVDKEILSLRRVVTHLTAALRAGGEPTQLSGEQFRKIAGHRDALLWDAERRRWWDLVRFRHEEDLRRDLESQEPVRVILAIYDSVFGHGDPPETARRCWRGTRSRGPLRARPGRPGRNDARQGGPCSRSCRGALR